jgi:hypothetical protein
MILLISAYLPSTEDYRYEPAQPGFTSPEYMLKDKIA